MLSILGRFFLWLIHWPWKRRTKAVIRPWEVGDIWDMFAIEQADDGPITSRMFFDWITEPEDGVYGIVIVEDGDIAGFAVAHPKNAYIQTLRVRSMSRRKRFGTRMLQHFCIALSVWQKLKLSTEISDANMIGKQFLERNGFGSNLGIAYHDMNDEVAETFLMMYWPKPKECTPEDMPVVDGDATL